MGSTALLFAPFSYVVDGKKSSIYKGASVQHYSETTDRAFKTKPKETYTVTTWVGHSTAWVGRQHDVWGFN